MSIPVQGRNHFIPLQAAVEMTRRFREMKDHIVKEEYKGKHINANSETFDRVAIDAILAQPGCVALRIYHGMDTGNLIHSIIVGVNDKDEDMLGKIQTQPVGEVQLMSADTTTDDTDAILENGFRCPPNCPPDSPLNT